MLGAIREWLRRGSRVLLVFTLRHRITQPAGVGSVYPPQRSGPSCTAWRRSSPARRQRIPADFLGGDRILLIVHGEVTAGIDLAKLDESKIDINGGRIALELPPAEIFSTRIDNERTRVYSRETGLFTMPDPNLESEARREAERQIGQSAIASGILKTAADNGRANITGLLEALGFATVVVVDEDQ